MSKTLVIILSETRASELTFNNIKKNLIDELQADLCVCIGVKPDYDYSNSFYKLAKYAFTYDEPVDYSEAFDYAYNSIINGLTQYEKLDNTNALYGKLQSADITNQNVQYYGKHDEDFDKSQYDDDELVFHTKDFPKKEWANKLYGIKKCDNVLVEELNIITYKKRLYWREFLKIKDQFMGGVKDKQFQHPGSAGILIFFRWFLLKKLKETNLIQQYDRFIITRSDFIYQLPHPKIETMNEHCIWIPDCENYEGYTDRHVVLSRHNIESYLNIFDNMVLRSNEYFKKMYRKYDWNLERLIKFHFEQNNVAHLVKEFPYIMYAVRNSDGPTRWAVGTYSKTLGYYIKYPSEYNKSSFYKKEFESSGLSLEEFYKKHIQLRKQYNVNVPVQLNKLDDSIKAEFTVDLGWYRIEAFANGVLSNSFNQVPDLCKKYMKYNNNNFELQWPKEMIDEMLECCKNEEYIKLSPNDYPNSSVQLFNVFKSFVNVTGKRCLVLGSISPWVECLLLHFNAESVTTLDYINPECNYKINILNMKDYKKEMKYDIIVSFSSLEHDGLGRYGDPLNPNGDIDACIEAYTMLNDHGFFICGIPIGTGCIEGNYHRIYNKKRIDKLFSLFDTFIGSVNYMTCDQTLNYIGSDWKNQPIFIYRK